MSCVSTRHTHDSSYLWVWFHVFVCPQVIYRDFKTSNVLLDAEGNALLSDFGLARDGTEGEQSHVTTRVSWHCHGRRAPCHCVTTAYHVTISLCHCVPVTSTAKLLQARTCLAPFSKSAQHHAHPLFPSLPCCLPLPFWAPQVVGTVGYGPRVRDDGPPEHAQRRVELRGRAPRAPHRPPRTGQDTVRAPGVPDTMGAPDVVGCGPRGYRTRCWGCPRCTQQGQEDQGWGGLARPLME